jgi:hypothetical protein
VTGLRKGQPTIVVRFLGGKEIELFSKAPTPALVPTQPVQSVVTAVASGLKWPGRKIYHSLLSRFDVESEWSHISTPSCAFKACTSTCYRLCLRTGRVITAYHREGPGSIPRQFRWVLLWTDWRWDRFFFLRTVVFSFQYHSANCPVFIHSYHWRHTFSVIYSVVKQHLKKLDLCVRNNPGEERVGLPFQLSSQ